MGGIQKQLYMLCRIPIRYITDILQTDSICNTLCPLYLDDFTIKAF